MTDVAKGIIHFEESGISILKEKYFLISVR